MKNKLFSKIISWSLIAGLSFQATPVWALSKDETIYTKLNSDGSVSSYVVSEHISGDGRDKSRLENIKNINGDEKYSEENGELVWENDGKDIYYQGTSKDELPITTSIKYYLNNEEKDVNDMIGKEGHVRIVIHYENKLKHNVLVNGKNEVLYTPFMIATTSFITNNDNTNIKVTNGKVIDNGINSIIIGLSSPGLYESLDLKELENFDTVEISYDTKSFELNAIYSAASLEVFNNDNSELFDKVNVLYDGVYALQNNMNKIVKGANELNDGTKRLASGTNELNNGIQKLTNKYYSYMNKDQDELEQEILDLIEKNIEKMLPSLEKDTEDEIKNVVNSHKKEIEKSAVDLTGKNVKLVVDQEIQKVINNFNMNEVLSELLNGELKETLESDQTINSIAKIFEEELVNELNKEINKTTKDAVNTTLDSLSTSLTNTMSEEEQVKYVQGIAEAYGITFEQAASIVAKVQGDTVNGIKANISKNKDTISTNVANDVTKKVISNVTNKEYVNSAMDDYLNEVNKKLANTLSTVDKEAYEKELKENLITAIKNDLSNNETIKNLINVSDYVNGIVDTELKKALDEYKDEIGDKLNELNKTISTLSSSVSQLNDGANKINDGMTTLNNGLELFNKDGIQKISKYVNGDLKTLQGKLEALSKLAKDYKTFDDSLDEATGSSKIIMVVDSIKNEEKTTSTKEEVIEEDKGLWAKIKGLFK